jgi:hypothetical protein
LKTLTFQIEDSLFAKLEKACESMKITTEVGLLNAIRKTLDTEDDDDTMTPEAQRLLAMIMDGAKEIKAKDKARIKAEREGIIKAVR